MEEAGHRALHELVVLPGASLQGRVCVLFTCKGTIIRARAAQNKVVKLAVDGKQKVIANDYTILALALFDTRRASPSQNKSPHMHSGAVCAGAHQHRERGERYASLRDSVFAGRRAVSNRSEATGPAGA